MKKLVLKMLLLVILTGAPFYWYVLTFAGGKTDSCYARFSSGAKPSLVIGVSDCAQGIVPRVFNESELGFARPLYNFCFLWQLSSYGPRYLSVLQEKLADTTRAGLFILGVNPWNLSLPRDKIDNRETVIKQDSLLARLHCYNCNPNFEYLFMNFGKPLYRVAMDYYSEEFIINEDGLDLVTIPYDTSRFNRSKAERLKSDALPGLKLSKARLACLEETIRVLQRHGEVVLVRLPTSREFAQLQETYSPDFDAFIEEIAARHSLLYCNLSKESGRYQTLDGSHLWRDCSIEISGKICAMIEEHRKRVSVACP